MHLMKSTVNETSIDDWLNAPSEYCFLCNHSANNPPKSIDLSLKCNRCGNTLAFSTSITSVLIKKHQIKLANFKKIKILNY